MREIRKLLSCWLRSKKKRYKMKTAFKFKTRPGSRKTLSVKGSEVAESKAQNELADVQSQVMTLALANFNFGPDTAPNFFKKDKYKIYKKSMK